MTAAELEIKVTTNTAEIEKLKSALGGVSKSSESMTGSMLKANVMFSLLEKGIGLVVNKVKASVEAFKAQEQAEQRLRTLIGGDISAYTNLASSIQKVTTVGDELSLQSMALAKTMGVTNDKLGQTTQNAIGLSKAFGVELHQATKMAVLASQGNYEALTRFIPALRTTKDLTEQQAIVNKAMADGFNIAKAEAETFGGRLSQLKNISGDILEEFGRIAGVIGKDTVESLIKSKEAFVDWMKSTEGIEKISKIAGTIGGVIETLKNIFTELGNVIKTYLMGVIDTVKTNFEKLVGKGNEANTVFNILSGAVKLIGIGFGIAGKLINFALTALTDFVLAIGKSGKAIGDSFLLIAGKKTWDQVKQSFKDAEDQTEIFRKNVIFNIEDLVTSIVDSFKKFPDDTLKQAEEWSKKYAVIVEKTQKATKDALEGKATTPLTPEIDVPLSKEIKINLDIISFKSQISEVASSFGELQDKMVSGMQNSINSINDSTKTFAQKFADIFSAIGSSIIGTLDIIRSTFEEFYGDQLSKLEEQHNAEIEAIDTRLAAEIELIQYNGMTKKQYQDQELADLQAKLAIETDATKQKDLQDKISALQKDMAITVSQQQANKAKEESDKKYAMAKYKNEVAQFETAKQLEIVMATINYLMGLVMLWANVWSLGPIAGAIMGGVMTGVLTGIFAGSVASIASKQPPPPPKFEQGTNFAPGGLALVGERGAELMNVPRGASITPADQTDALLSRPIIMQDKIVINGYEFAEIVRQVNVNNNRMERSRL